MLLAMNSAAKGAEAFYTIANNQARTETPEQARELDDKLIAAWTGHPYLRVIDNSSTFEDKMKRLLSEISAFLGEPEPIEIERKFLIRMPDLEQLAQAADRIIKMEQVGKVGFIVDCVKEVVSISEEQMESIKHDSKDDTVHFVNAVGKEADSIISLLDLNTVVLDKSIKEENA